MKMRRTTFFILAILLGEAIFPSCSSFRNTTKEEKTVDHWTATQVTAGNYTDWSTHVAVKYDSMVVIITHIPLKPDGQQDTTQQAWQETHVIVGHHEQKDTTSAHTSTETASQAQITDSVAHSTTSTQKVEHKRSFWHGMKFGALLLIIAFVAGYLFLPWRNLLQFFKG